MRKARLGSVGTLLLGATALLQTSWAHAQGTAEPPSAPKTDSAKPASEAKPVTPPAAKPGTEKQPAKTDPPKVEAETSSEATGATSAPPEGAPSEAPASESAPETKPTTPSPIANTNGGASADLGLYAPPIASAPAKPEETKAEADKSSAVFAEDWWGHTRPTLELHGNFRVRANLFSQFSLGRVDAPGDSLWPRPADDYYTDLKGTTYGPKVCTPAESNGAVGGTSGNSAGTSNNPPTGSTLGRTAGDATTGCSNSTQAGANLRFRIEPTLVISDNLRIRSQIDLFDNLVMGSTPEGYSNTTGSSGYQVSSSSTSLEASSQNPPVSGVNSLSDAIVVRRAWAEYETPVGQARFGRMPDHWGLGIHHNGGDGIDADYQTTVDRIAFVTGLPSLSLYAAGAWDFAKEGMTSQGFTTNQYPAYDVAQYDDVTAMNLQLFRRTDPQLEKLALARGDLVVNGGLYLTYRFQRIDNANVGSSATCATGANTLGCTQADFVNGTTGYVRRGLDVWTPDLFAEVKYKKFRFGAELVTHQGSIDVTSIEPGDNNYRSTPNNNGFKVNQWGAAAEITQYLVEDKLKLGLFFGWASGDGDTEGVRGLLSDDQKGDGTLSTFRFNPAYRVDFILNRHILRQVSGSYYIKPMAQYDFLRDPTGLRLGGRAEAIWTRASNFMQTPGHAADLGVELDGSVYYQSKDGALNDDPTQLGGFFAMINYAVFFPMNGLGYQSNQTLQSTGGVPGTETAQAVRLFLGVAY